MPPPWGTKLLSGTGVGQFWTASPSFFSTESEEAPPFSNAFIARQSAVEVGLHRVGPISSPPPIVVVFFRWGPLFPADVRRDIRVDLRKEEREDFLTPPTPPFKKTFPLAHLFLLTLPPFPLSSKLRFPPLEWLSQFSQGSGGNGWFLEPTRHRWGAPSPASNPPLPSLSRSPPQTPCRSSNNQRSRRRPLIAIQGLLSTPFFRRRTFVPFSRPLPCPSQNSPRRYSVGVGFWRHVLPRPPAGRGQTSILTPRIFSPAIRRNPGLRRPALTDRLFHRLWTKILESWEAGPSRWSIVAPNSLPSLSSSSGLLFPRSLKEKTSAKSPKGVFSAPRSSPPNGSPPAPTLTSTFHLRMFHETPFFAGAPNSFRGRSVPRLHCTLPAPFLPPAESSSIPVPTSQ